MNDGNAAFHWGQQVGMVVRGLLLGLFLATAVVGVVGHDSLTKIFRYEGF